MTQRLLRENDPADCLTRCEQTTLPCGNAPLGNLRWCPTLSHGDEMLTLGDRVLDREGNSVEVKWVCPHRDGDEERHLLARDYYCLRQCSGNEVSAFSPETKFLHLLAAGIDAPAS